MTTWEEAVSSFFLDFDVAGFASAVTINSQTELAKYGATTLVLSEKGALDVAAIANVLDSVSRGVAARAAASLAQAFADHLRLNVQFPDRGET